jgi:hypothetical protein
VELHKILEKEYEKVKETPGCFEQNEIPDLEMVRLIHHIHIEAGHLLVEGRHPLSELFADYLMQHSEAIGKTGILSVTTILQWSEKQCNRPTDPGFHSPRTPTKRKDIPNLCKLIDFSILPSRVANHLELLEVEYVGELVQLTPGELHIRRNFGKKTFRAIEKMLEEMDLSLSMRLTPSAQEALKETVKKRLKKIQNTWKKYDEKTTANNS